ncbi:hypothetical protein [Candidatus Clavichlamydia salmonicola]|uniref:hypothetical protein n=1 Tax=Candidatus Clavichlamydia salmonicola TaxID=469812 RepID=UPI001891298D|nr:hypothetical protein [Candidatus Clavichlamydia salmonicola]
MRSRGLLTAIQCLSASVFSMMNASEVGLAVIVFQAVFQTVSVKNSTDNINVNDGVNRGGILLEPISKYEGRVS